MYPTIINNNNNNNVNDEWILLINDDSSQSINIDSFTTSTNTTSTKSSEESFNSDDALALRILDDTYDYEAQRPFMLAYPQEENTCCYSQSTIKSITNLTYKNEVISCFFLIVIWLFLGFLLYLVSKI